MCREQEKRQQPKKINKWKLREIRREEPVKFKNNWNSHTKSLFKWCKK